MTARPISNSEVQSYLQCEQKHYYAHRLGLKPKTTGVALNRGIIGHEVLAEYYTARKDGATTEAAEKHALSHMTKMMGSATLGEQEIFMHGMTNGLFWK